MYLPIFKQFFRAGRDMKINEKQRPPVLSFSGNQFHKCSTENPLRSKKKWRSHLVCRSFSSFLRFILRLVSSPLYVILTTFNNNFQAKESPVAILKTPWWFKLFIYWLTSAFFFLTKKFKTICKYFSSRGRV